jgi:hypothetical protein
LLARVAIIIVLPYVVWMTDVNSATPGTGPGSADGLDLAAPALTVCLARPLMADTAAPKPAPPVRPPLANC